jgi:hypothetical protein
VRNVKAVVNRRCCVMVRLFRALWDWHRYTSLRLIYLWTLSFEFESIELRSRCVQQEVVHGTPQAKSRKPAIPLNERMSIHTTEFKYDTVHRD